MTEKEISKYVGGKIKEFRCSRNLTQQEIAEILNTTSQTVSRYESGILEPNQNTLFTLSDYFNVSIDDFFPERQIRNNNQIDEFELLFDKNKDILTEDDKEYMKFIIEKRKKEIDKQLGE